MIVLLTQYYSGDKIEKNEMGGECSAYGERKGVYSALVGKPEVNTGVDGRIILRWIFRKWNVAVWTGSSWVRTGQVVSTCDCGNELSGSIKCGKFLD